MYNISYFGIINYTEYILHWKDMFVLVSFLGGTQGRNLGLLDIWGLKYIAAANIGA